MNANQYLEEYHKTYSQDLYRGPSGWLRRQLDLQAARSGQDDRHALFLPRVFDLIGLDSAQPLEVLDIGCGDGKMISYAAPNIVYSAVDRGDVYQTSLESRGIRFTMMDIESGPLPYPDNAFDLVMMNHLIEHVRDYDALVSELWRITRPDRYIYIRTPDIERRKFAFFDDYTHVKPYTRAALTTMMQAHGFRCVRFLQSDHPRINFDIMTGGKFRRLLFGSTFGGAELEAAFQKCSL